MRFYGASRRFILHFPLFSPGGHELGQVDERGAVGGAGQFL
jgi:hypothetical protein